MLKEIVIFIFTFKDQAPVASSLPEWLTHRRINCVWSRLCERQKDLRILLGQFLHPTLDYLNPWNTVSLITLTVAQLVGR
jgi:hypothetical protein